MSAFLRVFHFLLFLQQSPDLNVLIDGGDKTHDHNHRQQHHEVHHEHRHDQVACQLVLWSELHQHSEASQAAHHDQVEAGTQVVSRLLVGSVEHSVQQHNSQRHQCSHCHLGHGHQQDGAGEQTEHVQEVVIHGELGEGEGEAEVVEGAGITIELHASKEQNEALSGEEHQAGGIGH